MKPSLTGAAFSAQRIALRDHMAANTNTILINGIDTAIQDIPHGADNAQKIAAWYNQAVVAGYFVVRSDVPKVDIRNTIVWQNYTPAPAITSGNAAQHTAASNACMAKQGVLDLLGINTDGTFDATKFNQTAGLKDATTGLPSAAAFATQAAGWGNPTAGVWSKMTRLVTVHEKLFVTQPVQNTNTNPLYDGTSARGTAGNPDLMPFEGDLTADEVLAAWAE